MAQKLSVVVVVFALVASVATAGFVGAAGSAQSNASTTQAQAAANQTTISVSATGSVSAQPDSAALFVASTASAENATQATQQLAANVSTLRDALEAAGIPSDAIRTTDFQVFQQRDDGNATYVARQSFEVTVSNTSNVGPIIDVAVANGATDVFGVEFQLSPERQQELRSEAIDLALEDARDQATAVASSTNLTLGEPRAISVGSGGFTPIIEHADAGTEIDASPVTVTVSVQVTYNASTN